MKALQVFAGPRALAHLRQRGLRPLDVKVVAAAAGGPKGLALIPIDRFVFGDWLAKSSNEIHLLGASIGAWRMACAMQDDSDRALAELAEDYIVQHYPHAPGRAPTADIVTRVFGDHLRLRFGGRELTVLDHKRWRLHVFTSHGRGLLAREGRLRTTLGFMQATMANAISRRTMACSLRRVAFSDPRSLPPMDLRDFATQHVPLSQRNLTDSLLASCSIPFWFRAVHDIPGGPEGAYWDGGLTDYHLHLNFASMADGLVLYPHFQSRLVPGWLDKPWHRRHLPTAALDNLILLAPHPDWVRNLPGGKLPDRGDFKTFGDDEKGRARVWRQALAESGRFADEFAEWLSRARIEAQPLA